MFLSVVSSSQLIRFVLIAKTSQEAMMMLTEGCCWVKKNIFKRLEWDLLDDAVPGSKYTLVMNIDLLQAYN